MTCHTLTQRCNTLQHPATTCYNTLQHTATHDLPYAYTALRNLSVNDENKLRILAAGGVLQRAAARCKVLQCFAVFCSVLQCVVDSAI